MTLEVLIERLAQRAVLYILAIEMLVQVIVDDDVEVEVVRQRATSKGHQPVPQRVNCREEPLEKQSVAIRILKTSKSHSKTGEKSLDHPGIITRNVGQCKPLVVYVGSHVKKASGMVPASLTAGFWVDTGDSFGLNYMYNVVNCSAINNKVADLGALYAALTSPELKMLMQDRPALHLVSGTKRAVDIINKAQLINAQKFRAVLAVHIRTLLSNAPHRVRLLHVLDIKAKGGSGAAGVSRACALAERCHKHSPVCCLPAHAHLLQLSSQ